MAEILIKAVDAVNADPANDKACYKAGDPVVVKPDEWAWGKEEGPPNFYILKLPGIPVDDVINGLDLDSIVNMEVKDVNGKFLRRRAFNFNLLLLPADLASKGTAETNKATLSLALIDMRI